MAASSDVVALTGAYRQAQIRRATVIAALVAAYYRQKVVFNSPGSVQAWLDFVVPKIMAEHDRSSQLGATFGDTVRKIELPDLRDGFRFEPVKGAVAEQVKSSLLVVGPTAELKQVERHQLGGRFAGELADPALGRMQPQLQGVDLSRPR